ncbi:MAG: PAS domain S-box [Parcubacteria group bacterium Gr01-1014_72]|nr:MAG: PAS domain S-box [Parcubacteria group bacterium Gr01-1014_72]
MKRESHRKKILIVEDEEVLASLLSKKLTEAGYAVEIAADGETGYAKAKSQKPDIVLLDMLLPKMNGMEILKRLREDGILPSLPVLVISNSGQPVELDEVRRLGVRDYLIKLNFNPEDVLERVNTVFRTSTPETSGSASPTSHAASKKSAASEHERHERTVLIVEDDTLLSKLLSRKLIEHGFKALVAPHVVTARALLENNRVDFILLDIILPEVNGFEFLKELKTSEKYKAIPVFIVSNLGQEDEIRKGHSLGAIDFIIKATLSPADIAKKVELYFASKR